MWQNIDKKGHLIVFAGIDGAGKTTQVQVLAKLLVDQGHTVFVPPKRPNFSRDLLRLIAREVGQENEETLLGADTSHLIVAMEHLRTWTQTILPKLEVEGQFVLLDRYVYCQYALTQLMGAKNGWLIRRIFQLVPPADLVLYIDTPPELAQQRIAERGEDNENLEMLRRFEYAYRCEPEFDWFAQVDGRRSVADVHKQVYEHILARLPEALGARR